MAGLTLAQSADLTNDKLQSGVIETMATESKLLAVLPFMTIEGAGYAYNVETELSDVQFRAINKPYDPSTVPTERRTEHLVILGGEAVVDSFQIEVHSDINDLLAVETSLKAKAVAHQYEKTFIDGDTGNQANAFDGIKKRALAEQKIAGTADDLAGDIDVVLDMVAGGADALIMNKKTRRALNKEARNNVSFRTNEFGVQIAQFGGVDIIDVESELGVADDEVIAVSFGTREAVAGLQSKSGLKVKSLGEQGDSPQVKTRIEWFCGLAVFNDYKLAIRNAPSDSTA